MLQIFSRLRCETTGDSRNLSAINNLANEVLTTYARSQDRTEVSGHLPYDSKRAKHSYNADKFLEHHRFRVG
jgi:hypothetical protein